MEKLLEWLSSVEDQRQQWKVEHLMQDIIALVYFALLANASEWTEIYYFGVTHEHYLKKYLKLPYGIPSHDTIQRVFAMVSSAFLQEFHLRWNEVLCSDEGDKIKKILSLDGKAQRGNGSGGQQANHIVSAVDERGFCLSERLVDEKSNEITALPHILDDLNIQGHIITIDAIGTQTAIVQKIHKKRADYVLALKGNQGTLHEDVHQYFDDPALLSACAYTKTVEKARSGIEIREYWQTDDIAWLSHKKNWAGLQSIAMTRNTITKNDETTTEQRLRSAVRETRVHL
jgi:predicted transposase YbfD/YdcC